MFWGVGFAPGFIAVLGYAVFVCGAALLWFNRLDIPVWVHDELAAVRRSVIRHAVSITFHGLREEVSCSAKPTGFMRRLARRSRRRINQGTILLTIGLLLFFINFFV